MSIADRFERFFCGLKGHKTVKAYDAGHMYLSCMNCGWRSSGWNLRQSSKKKVAYLNLQVSRDRRIQRIA